MLYKNQVSATYPVVQSGTQLNGRLCRTAPLKPHLFKIPDPLDVTSFFWWQAFRRASHPCTERLSGVQLLDGGEQTSPWSSNGLPRCRWTAPIQSFHGLIWWSNVSWKISALFWSSTYSPAHFIGDHISRQIIEKLHHKRLRFESRGVRGAIIVVSFLLFFSWLVSFSWYPALWDLHRFHIQREVV